MIQINLDHGTIEFSIYRENTQNIRNFQRISHENEEAVRYGQETIKVKAPSLWANLPEKYTLVNSLAFFNRKIKNWKCQTRPCRLCQTFQKNLGFI